MRKQWIALLCVLGLSLGMIPCTSCSAKSVEPIVEPEETQPVEENITYSDIAGDEWFVSAVDTLTEAGIMTGLEGGIFGPYEPVTRATVITVLWRLEGSPEATVEVPFTDAEEDWYAVQAAWAKGTGIATGYVDGSFGGRDIVTREQLASFISRYATYKGEPLASGMLGLFKDADAVSEWAEEGVRHAVGLGILQGDDLGYLDPGGVANRAALAVMLQRMLTPAVG